MPWPRHCHYCGGRAAWTVTSPTRAEIVCDGHLTRARKWVGPDAVVVAVEQPGGAAQEALFDLKGSGSDTPEGNPEGHGHG